MRFDGKLKSWNDERGFGFIEPVQGGGDTRLPMEDQRLERRRKSLP